jgi:hypothetical protein
MIYLNLNDLLLKEAITCNYKINKWFINYKTIINKKFNYFDKLSLFHIYFIIIFNINHL